MSLHQLSFMLDIHRDMLDAMLMDLLLSMVQAFIMPLGMEPIIILVR